MIECELCATASRRFNTKNRCCKVRQIAQLPRDARTQAYDKVRKEEGKDEANDLIASVNLKRKKMREENAQNTQET